MNELQRISARVLLFASAFAFLFKARWGVRIDKMLGLRRCDSLSAMEFVPQIPGLSGLNPCRAVDRPDDVRVRVRVLGLHACACAVLARARA